MKIPSNEAFISLANDLCTERFSPGIDNISAKSNLTYFLINIHEIVQSLQDGTYRPKPALSFAILKKNGKPRELCRFCAQDTVIQRALAVQLAEELKDSFSAYSYAYRKGLGVHSAIEQFLIYSQKYNYVAKIDPISCYDNIDRNLLAKKVNALLGKDAATRLLLQYAQTDIADEKGIHKREKGILQGSPLSPILCNIYFDSLDKYLEKEQIPFCRYADDVVVFSDDADGAQKNANSVVAYLSEKLMLAVNPDKFTVTDVENFNYLGYGFIKDSHGLFHAIEQPASSTPKATDYWVRSKTAKSNKTINILSDGVLSRKDLTVIFANDEESDKIPVEAVEQINVYSSVVFSPGIMEMAFKHGITISIFDKYGYLLGRFLPEKPFKNVNISLNQLEIYKNKTKLRADYARDFLISQIHNVRLNLRYQRKQYQSLLCSDAIEAIDKIEADVKKMCKPEEMLLAEAEMRRIYYGCFSEFIKNQEFSFTKRTKRPPKDRVNAIISFANTFLYHFISCEICKTPLDIRIAFLHSTTSRPESLNLDIADVFKPLIVDRTVFLLINKRMLKPEHFVTEKTGAVLLTNTGKKVVINALYDKLEQTVPVKNEHKKYYQIIKDEIQTLCADVKGLKKHKSFRQIR